MVPMSLPKPALKLITDGGTKFDVSETAVKTSCTLEELLACFGESDSVDTPILVHFDSQLLDLGLQWCEQQRGEEFRGLRAAPYSRRYVRIELTEWQTRFLSTGIRRLTKLAYVAEFLRIPTLYLAACAAIADSMPVNCDAKGITKRERDAFRELFLEAKQCKDRSEWISDRMLLDILRFMDVTRLERCKLVSSRCSTLANKHSSLMPRELLESWIVEESVYIPYRSYSYPTKNVELGSLARFGVLGMKLPAGYLSAALSRLANAKRRSIRVRDLTVEEINLNDATELSRLDALLDKIGFLQKLRLWAPYSEGFAGAYKIRNCNATLHLSAPSDVDASVRQIMRLCRVYDGPKTVDVDAYYVRGIEDCLAKKGISAASKLTINGRPFTDLIRLA